MIPVAAALLTVLVVANGVRRAHASRWRLAAAVAAAAVGASSLLALDGPADSRLSAHMLQHVLFGDLAPLLLVLSLGGGVLGAIPVPSALRRAGAFAARPLPAFVLWVVPIAVWHVPALYDAALTHEKLHELEHVTFAIGGALVWVVLLDPARRGLLRGWGRFAYAIGLLVPTQLLANVLVLSYRPLYPAYGSLHDQNLAGLVMMAEQLATLGTFAVLTARALVRGAAPNAGRHPLSV